MAQARLGPGRIHHCMRIIGMYWLLEALNCFCARSLNRLLCYKGLSERVLHMMRMRVTHRTAFGKPLASHGTIQHDIAKSRIEIDQVNLQHPVTFCLSGVNLSLCTNHYRPGCWCWKLLKWWIKWGTVWLAKRLQWLKLLLQEWHK